MSYKCTSCEWEGELVNYADGPICPECSATAEVKCENCQCVSGNGCCGSCSEEEDESDV